MRRPAELHGILAIDKPQGWTSHDVVARVRRLSGQRQVGHAGTLDPLATGLLPLGLGQATRVLEYFSGGRKTYRATILLGAETDTYDAQGRVIRTAAWDHISPQSVRAALTQFTGEILQRPPAFSAIKQDGEAMYRRARRGETVEVAPRPVVIYRLEMIACELPELQLEVECSSGTYVRSLAHDLGRALGSAGHLTALRRLRVGSLGLAEARTLAELEAELESLPALLLNLDRPLWSTPAIVLDAEHTRWVLQGRSYAGQASGKPLCRAYSSDGRFLAALVFDAKAARWRPRKVFGTA